MFDSVFFQTQQIEKHNKTIAHVETKSLSVV